MTVLPESPVREYIERVAGLMEVAREAKISPVTCQAGLSMPFQGGYRAGLSTALTIVAEQASLCQETTRYEYRVIGRMTGSNAQPGDWHETEEQVQVDYRHHAIHFDFDHLYIERRTVTVTQPVRLDDDGEPIS